MSRLHVESLGEGRPFVLLHGWAMHGGVFAPLAAALARRFRVHAVDLPGHGRSAPVEPYTLGAIVAALRERFDAGGEASTVLGWSFGAMVAIAWAIVSPARIARLVLVGATPRFTASQGWPHAMAAETLRRFHDELRVAYRPTLNRFLALQVHGSEHGRAALQAMREALFAHGEPSPQLLQCGLDVLAGADLRAQAASVGVPTLVIAGGRDALTPPEAGAWLARAMPNAKLVRIEGAAHAPFLSHPVEFARALDAFVDGR